MRGENIEQNCENIIWKKSALAPGLFFCPPIPAVLMVQDFLIKIMMNDFLKDIANIVLF